MQLPAQANTSDFYKLVSGALLNSDRGYGSIDAFFKNEFNEYFTDAKWRQLFPTAPENRNGTYTQLIGKINVPVMAAYVAMDAEGPKISNTGFEATTKDLPRMKLAYDFNEKSIRDGQYLIANNGRPEFTPIFNSFMVDSQYLLTGVHMQINYTAYQIESTGKYISTATNNGGGIRGLQYDFQVPAANKKAAGGYGTKGAKKVWSDATAYPIGDLQDMADFADDNYIMGEARVFRMNKKTWNLLKNHPTTRAAVAMQITKGSALEANLPKYAITDTEIVAYLSALNLPPIEIVPWSALSQWIDPATQKLVKFPLAAFADNTVLLRPSGAVGKLQWQAPTTLFATSANPMYTTDNGLIGVQQEVFSGRKAMQFTAEATCIPVPDDVTSMLYLDIATAAA